MREELELAEAAVREGARTRNDRWYPQFHIAAESGWINDPNGLSFFADRYQVYFQHHPFGTLHGPMHWGHVSSLNMVKWSREPIALAPSVVEDRNGVFSGSAVVADDGRTLAVYYTGNRWVNGVNEDQGIRQVQMMSESDDGVHFRSKRMVVDAPPGVTHFRDPKVWKMADTWYMVFGACSKDNRGQVWLYTSSDMENWRFDQVIYEDPDPDVFMLECPDMFPLDGKWVLSYCPMGLRPRGHVGRNHHNAGYVVGDWAPGGAFEIVAAYRPSDWGHDYYAPQSFEAPDGRRIAFGWMGGFDRPLPPQEKDGWSGQLTVPRVQTLGPKDTLRSEPVPELKQLRLKTHDFGALSLGENAGAVLLSGVGPMEIEAEVDISAMASERIGFEVQLTEDGHHTFVGYDAAAGRVFLDRRMTAFGDGGVRSAAIEGDRLKLRVFVDNGSVELFANDGMVVLSSCCFPGEGPRAVKVSSEGGAVTFSTLVVHDLDTIWES